MECIWLLEGEGSAPRAQKVVPDGCTELIVHLRDPFQRVAPRGAVVQPRSFFVGQITRPLLLQAGRRVRTLGIRFRPGGAGPFLRAPLHELTDATVPLEAIWGGEAARFEEALSESPQPLAAAAALLAREVGGGADPLVQAAVAEILGSRGRLGVAALARAAGLGTRQLERRFLAAVGLPPKQLCRIVRFQGVFHRLAREDAGDWVQVALDCGYSDQAHLIRDFRDLAGETPPRYLAAEGQLSRFFTSPARLEAFFAPPG